MSDNEADRPSTESEMRYVGNLFEMAVAEGQRIIDRSMERYLNDPVFHATVSAASRGAVEQFLVNGNEEMKLVAATCKADPGIASVIVLAAAIAAQIVRPSA